MSYRETICRYGYRNNYLLFIKKTYSLFERCVKFVIIGITGDTHGDLYFSQVYQAKRRGITHLIVCGDFGYIWDGSIKEQRILDYLSNIGITILFVDGNHENHVLLNSYKKENMFGGSVHKIRDNIIHLIRGEVYSIGGKKFFAFGGANSIDKEFRTEGKSWWKEEKPTEKEKKHARSILKNHNNKVDYILTHTCYPLALNCVGGDMRRDDVSDFLNEIRHTVEFDYWFFGHMHIDFNIVDYKTRCIYKNILRIDI